VPFDPLASAEYGGKTTALMNTSGTVVERYVYDPYGKPTFYGGDWATASATRSPTSLVV